MRAIPASARNIFIRFGTNRSAILFAEPGASLLVSFGFRPDERGGSPLYWKARLYVVLVRRMPGNAAICAAGRLRANIQRDGALVTFTVAADGFLYNMVRIMVGTLLYVAQDKLQPEQIPEILAARDRTDGRTNRPPVVCI